MLRTMLSLLSDKDFQCRARKSLTDFVNQLNFNSAFELEDNTYVMVLNVPEATTGNDIDVEYDEETNTISVKYSFENGRVSFSNTVVETLPSNADVDTLTARVVNGVLTVTVDALPEPEPEEEILEEEYVDPTIVSIKRKNK
jgi:HSP20 family molecular chaperone IbpA